MLESGRTNVLRVTYEDFRIDGLGSLSAICSHLSIPALNLSINGAEHGTDQAYNGPLEVNTCAMAWCLGYKVFTGIDARDFRFIRLDALHGTMRWVQKGSPSKPALVFVHALTGIGMGSIFQSYLPPDTPIVSIQAPELIGDSAANSIYQRAAAYRDALVTGWGDRAPVMYLVGYSFSGVLALELARCLKESMLDCASLCLIDPSPCSPLNASTESYLM